MSIAPAPPAEATTPTNAFKQISLDIAKAMSLMLTPARLSDGPAPTGNSKYCHMMHIELCRLKLLGLADAAAAKAAGINPETLRNWIQTNPILAEDLERAQSLSNAQAAVLLQVMMHGDDQRAFQAVRFFLESHSPEFKKDTVITIRSDLSGLAKVVREQIYGLPVEIETVKSTAENAALPAELPEFPIESISNGQVEQPSGPNGEERQWETIPDL